ncbi:hypothetical protein ACIRQY_29150 [Streptomyces sp. NPDC101490]
MITRYLLEPAGRAGAWIAAAAFFASPLLAVALAIAGTPDY